MVQGVSKLRFGQTGKFGQLLHPNGLAAAVDSANWDAIWTSGSGLYKD